MKDKQKIHGFIGMFGLADWWLNTFTEEEKRCILYRVRNWRIGPNVLLEGDFSWMGKIPSTRPSTASSFLSLLAFNLRRDHSIARRIALKASELAENVEDIYDALGWLIRLYYPVRNSVPEALDIVIASCKHSIALAPLLAYQHRKEYPRLGLGKHEGYNRYVIILEKNHDYSEAIRLCEEAKHEGWMGDWDIRIERCNKRLANQKPSSAV
jgi:hypothetical protein